MSLRIPGRRIQKKSKAKFAKNSANGTLVAEIKYVPEPFRQGDNGWQMRRDDVKSRIAALFNCFTMHDVLFDVEAHKIPAHSFILCSASPIFYRQLFESGQLDNTSPQVRQDSIQSDIGDFMNMHAKKTKVHTVTITAVPHLAFFEFLQFIYTDEVQITLDNVLSLIFLADTYKVAGLSEQCLEFVSAEVVPKSVIRVLRILEILLLKAVMSCWLEQVEQRRALEEFRRLTLAERRAQIEAMEASTSRIGIPSPGRRSGRNSNQSSMVSMSRNGSLYRDSDDEYDVCDESENNLDLVAAYRHNPDTETRFSGAMTDTKVAQFVEDVTNRSWKCIQAETSVVLQCPEMWEQDLKFLRNVLSMENCSVPEIQLFRTAVEWAKQRCMKTDLVPSADNIRRLLGNDTLLLIRFPTMSLEEVQWEVVPTGLLKYEDVQALLHQMTTRTAVLGKYVATPRNNPAHARLSFRTQKTMISLVGTYSDRLGTPGTPSNAGFNKTGISYVADRQDPVDAIVAAELLKSYLSRTAEESEPAKGGVRQTLAVPEKLPPISPAAALQQQKGAASPRRDMKSVLAHRRTSVEMVMGKRLDTYESEEGIVFVEGGRRTEADDLVRLAKGIYKFRQDRLVEVWLEGGEAMARDHGPCEHLLRHQANLPSDIAELRRFLGLGEHPQFGRGLPLTSFLGRQ